MQCIDIYEMIETQLAQPPYNLPETDGRRQELIYDLVAHIPPRVFADALRNIAEATGLRMDSGDDYDDYDDSMDGDFDSGMASAGFGTDEDYGYYGEY
tara:strand:- start:412 stop:705 length:294 start_codon:yes stop_codon:yes gene_type:complete